MSMSASIDNLERANTQRTQTAGPEIARLARQALDEHSGRLTPAMRLALEARAARPLASWSELAEQTGTTKDALTSGCLRALAAAGLKVPRPRSGTAQRRERILAAARAEPDITMKKLAAKLGISYAIVYREITQAQVR
jgi:DNA-binding MarR family transcriptional regulator